MDSALPLAEVMLTEPDAGLSWHTRNHGFVQHVAVSVAQLVPDAALVMGGPETRTVFESEPRALPEDTIPYSARAR